MSDYTLSFHLQQLTPMLHFQGDTPGAALRPSEVKPKLDRYIYGYLQRQGFPIPAGWLCKAMDGEKSDNPHHAFRYKLQLRAVGEISPEKNRIHALYFGNQGDNTAGYKSTVFYPDGVDGQILFLTTETSAPARLFGEEREFTMAQILCRLLSPFFQLHCFGTRSNKGFGSFLLAPSDEIPAVSVGDLVDYLPEDCTNLYKMTPASGSYRKGYRTGILGRDGTVSFTSAEAQLNDILVLSAAMKGGFNRPYIKGYVQTVKGGRTSEKAFIKSKVFRADQRDAYNRSVRNGERIQAPTPGEAEREYFFVRGALGLTDSYRFRIGQGIPDITIRVSDQETDKDKKITRFANPITYHPLEDVVLILIHTLPDELLRHHFQFDNPRHTLDIPKLDINQVFRDYLRNTHSRNRNTIRAADTVPVFRYGEKKDTITEKAKLADSFSTIIKEVRKANGN